MKDSEMWIVIKQVNDSRREGLVLVPLSDVASIASLECGLIVVHFTDSGKVTLSSDLGEGIVYKGGFIACLGYINNKENFK